MTQNAADAAAVAGAGWVARSLNAVAMSNVEQARLIATVNYLDAVPLAAALTLEDQRAALTCAQNQLGRGVGSDTWVRDGLRTVIEDVSLHIDELEPVDELLNRSGFDLTETTFYDAPGAPGGRGRLWSVIEAFDLFGQAVMATLPELPETAASVGGRANLTERGVAGQALVVPVVAEIPWARGVFDDFERPVVDGLLAVGVDDSQFRRGPFDTVFGWRTFGHEGGRWDRDNTIGSGYDEGWGLGGSGGQWQVDPDPIDYRVYGPHGWLTRLVWGWDSQGYPKTRWDDRTRFGARVKLGYLWPGAGGIGGSGGSGGAVSVNDPQWITGYGSAEAVAQSDPAQIYELQFILIEYLQQVVGGVAQGSPEYQDWMMWYPRGAGRIDPGGTRVTDYIWRVEQHENQVFDDEGVLVSEQIRYTYAVFAGANIGDATVEIRNPHNFGSRGDLPAPIDLIHAALDWDDAPARLDRLTWLGIAQLTSAGRIWPASFSSPAGYGHHLALAQASVFNNHSWDLWTPMWQARLEPIGDFDHWVAQTDAARGNAALIEGMDDAQLDALAQYLADLEPLSRVMLNH